MSGATFLFTNIMYPLCSVHSKCLKMCFYNWCYWNQDLRYTRCSECLCVFISNSSPVLFLPQNGLANCFLRCHLTCPWVSPLPLFHKLLIRLKDLSDCVFWGQKYSIVVAVSCCIMSEFTGYPDASFVMLRFIS